jgi:hypothetical protein
MKILKAEEGKTY